MRTRVKVSGIVQGVGFRPFIYRTAVRLRLKGYVRNRGDAGVEILLEGKEKMIREFLTRLEIEKPPLAQIDRVLCSEIEGKNAYESFLVEKSSDETEISGSIIPPDVAICNDCLRELRDPEDPRFEYFFITCTNCGPRFTIIEKLPYDRENTTMREFPICDFCEKEYRDPMNRRFHAQTIACPECGPRVWLADREGNLVEHGDPIREAGRLLSEGNILAVKGYGGFHVAASTTKDPPLAKLREVKHRSQKPFAVMAKSLSGAKTFAEVDRNEEDLLCSYSRPIVLLKKRCDYYLSEMVAPGLHNVGVMLPYTGLHYMLFDRIDDASIVMTSANPPDQPIIKENQEALRTLNNIVDYFLFHNRQIAHRCDDSVLRTHPDRSVFLRRSRGYAPVPILLKEPAEKCVLALGGELNNTICILNENKAFISQHIGDVENVETRTFLETATNHLTHLTNSKVEIVACDLHPKFTTTAIAHDLAEANGWRLVQIQHHYAHVAGLMIEHNAEEMIGICCDGYGYGPNGEAWGGEILLCGRRAPGYKRLAHLEAQPLIGGDLATRYPLRLAAGMLSSRAPVEKWLLENKCHFPHGEGEVEILFQQLKNLSNFAKTTSCGRVLDAVSAILGICYERTYEAEPSMKLESAATSGKDALKLKPLIRDDVLDTTLMLQAIYESRSRFSVEDLAKSAHAYMARGLATMAVEKAEEANVKTIGFSGGVACNEIIATTVMKIVEDAGLLFLSPQTVPPGDGGLSFGQAVASGFLNF
jgi:hydrogenase maturation protein HypF